MLMLLSSCLVCANACSLWLGIYPSDGAQLTNVDHVLKGVGGLSSLRYLSMMHNPCTPDCFAKGKDAEDYATFRLHIIFKIGSLCCLDYQDISPAEREKAGAVGAFAKTASPRETGGGGAAVLELTIDDAVDEVDDDHLTRGSEFQPA
jgi:hypothetical protein